MSSSCRYLSHEKKKAHETIAAIYMCSQFLSILYRPHFMQEHLNVLAGRYHSASVNNRRSSSARRAITNRSLTPTMDANHLNAEHANTISIDEKPKNDDTKVDINENDEETVATQFANDLIASPNFLRIPLKPIEKLPNDYSSNEMP